MMRDWSTACSRLGFVATVGAFAALVSPASANAWDGQSPGPAYGLAPLAEKQGDPVPDGETPIKLESKRVSFRRTTGDDEESHFFAPGKWRINARYRLANPTSEDRSVTAVLPEPRGRWRGRYEDSPTGRRAEGYFRVRMAVGGESASIDRKRAPDGDAWPDPVAYLHAIQVPVPAGATTVIRVRYDREFILHGGHSEAVQHQRLERKWSGPVERMRYAIRLRTRPWGFYYLSKPEGEEGRTPRLVDYREWLDGEQPVTRIAFEVHDREPLPIFRVTIWESDGLYSDPFVLRNLEHDCSCPPYDTGEDFANRDGESSRDDYLEGILDRKVLSAEKCRAAGADRLKRQLRYCRNAPFARHGYDFDDPDLDEYFYGEYLPTEATPPDTAGSWNTYIGPRRRQKMGAERALERLRFVGLRKNPHYTRQLLLPRDLAYVRLVEALEEYVADHPSEFD